MSDEKKMELLAEVLDCDEDISLDVRLSDLEEWDSVAILSFIAMMDEEFGRTVKGEEVRKIETVKDALDFMTE